MKRLSAGLAGLLSLLVMCAAPAAAWDRGRAEIFAVLPAGSTGPEGLTVGFDGNIYVTTFGFNSMGAVNGPGQLFVYTPDGRLLRQVAIAGSTSHLLLTFDNAGNVYVSDSFQGIIWKTGAAGGAGTAWVADKLLTTTGVPGFGANGIEFNNAEDTLFVANTGDDTIVAIPVTKGTPGTPAVLTNSINGADGIVLDRHGNIWVAANQADEIVVIDPSGKAIAKLGDFNGVDEDGLPHGLFFPASPAFSLDGRFLYVTNLALDLRKAGGPQTVDSQWADEVKRYTVSRLRAAIPPLGGDDD